jgi:lactoylglutathione lyase/glyoxylase I family protein
LFKPKGGEFDDDLPDLPDDDDDLPDLPDDDDFPDLPDDDDDFPRFGRKRDKDFDFDLSAAPAPAPAATPPAAPVGDEESFDIGAVPPSAAPADEEVSFAIGAAPAHAATPPAAPVDDEESFDIGAVPPSGAPVYEEEAFDIGAIPVAAAPLAVAAKPEPKPDPGPDPVFDKIAHVCLTVKDLGRSIEYYTKLGFKKRFMFNKGGNIFGVYFEFGKGNFIELFEDTVNEFSRGRIAHFCLETQDIDAVAKSLSRRGIEYAPKKLGCDSTYQIWLRDPDGNEFEVHQYTPGSSQIIGKDVDADW